MVKRIPYYVSGHTAEGYVNYLFENLQGIQHVIVLQHENEPALTVVFQHVAEAYEKKGETVEVISGLEHEDTLAGVILRGLNTAILASSVLPTSISSATVIDIENYMMEAEKAHNRDQEKEILDTVYAFFKKGLEYHDELEQIFIQEMDFTRADEITKDFIQKLLHDADKKNRQPIVYERLFGTNTPDGKVNHVSALIAPFRNVYYVKGRAGTGKSVFMKKILNACKSYGYDIEMYRCSFDPSSVDMIIVRDLDFCVFDSTPPHEFFPDSGQGEVIDFYELTVTQGTDEKYQKEIAYWTEKYQSEMKKGMQELKALKHVYREPSVNFHVESVLDTLYDKLDKT